MPTEEAHKLIEKYKAGNCNPSERSIIESWYNYQSAQRPALPELADSEALFARFKSSLPIVEKRKIPIRLPLKWGIGIAAMLAAVFFIKHYFVTEKKSRVEIQAGVVNISGKNAATLTLSDGTKIPLNDVSSGKVMKIRGLEITQTPDGKLIYAVKNSGGLSNGQNTLETQSGEQFELILSDKSRIFLNAKTSVKFPTSFAGLKERNIELDGEAYFEVEKDETKPFKVRTKDQSLTVLGTHFNVSAYMEDGIVKTALLEGKVKINANTILLPGQVANNKYGEIEISNSGVERETAWIKNDFFFQDESTEDVLREISRWYGISVNYEEPALKSIRLSGYISRNKSLDTVLERIANATDLKFVLKGKLLIVQKN